MPITTTRLVTLLVLFATCVGADRAEAGEWMFRLRSAHIDIRHALFDRDPDAAWEHVDRETRQEAGLLAGRIRDGFSKFDPATKRALADRLGLDDPAGLATLRGPDILVSKPFLEAHAYLLDGSRDDDKRKDWGTKMAGPTGMVIGKGTPGQRVVPFTFTTGDHFGGQAMDYRARLPVPSLDNLLGPAPERATPNADDVPALVMAVFDEARAAFTDGDVETLWPLLDCLGHSQASHFADQAHEFHAKQSDPTRVPRRLEITAERLAALDGPNVWSLPWSLRLHEHLVEGTNPTFVPAETSRVRGKDVTRGPFVEVTHCDRTYRLEFALNHRSGAPQYKLVLRAPKYELIRSDPRFETNDFEHDFRGLVGTRERLFEFEKDTALVSGFYTAGGPDGWAAEVADDGLGHFHLLLFPRGVVSLRTSPDDYRLVNATMEDGRVTFRPEQPVFGVESIDWEKGLLSLRSTDGTTATLKQTPAEPSPTMGVRPEGADVLFDGTSIDAWLHVQRDSKERLLYAYTDGAETKAHYVDFRLHLEFRTGLDHERPTRSPMTVSHGNWQVRLQDTFGFDSDELGGHGPVTPVYTKQHGKHFTRLHQQWDSVEPGPAIVCGELFVDNRRGSDRQSPNHCRPPLEWQTIDLTHVAARGDSPAWVTVVLNGRVVHDGVEIVSKKRITGPQPVRLKGVTPLRNVWISTKIEDTP